MSRFTSVVERGDGDDTLVGADANVSSPTDERVRLAGAQVDPREIALAVICPDTDTAFAVGVSGDGDPLRGRGDVVAVTDGEPKVEELAVEEAHSVGVFAAEFLDLV